MTSNVRSRALWATALVPALVLAIGCAKPTPVGKWSGDIGVGTAVLELKGDGTFTQASKVDLLGGDILASGSYTYKDDKMDLTVKDVQAKGKSVLNLIPAQYRNQLNKSVTWKRDGENLIIDSKTFTPVK